jgi:antitoxin ParD1/3/4
MATMNVSLPDGMKEWVEQQSRSDGYSNASDYVRDLIRQDRERTLRIGHMQKQVNEGIGSGVGGRSMDELLDAARQQFSDD